MKNRAQTVPFSYPFRAPFVPFSCCFMPLSVCVWLMLLIRHPPPFLTCRPPPVVRGPASVAGHGRARSLYIYPPALRGRQRGAQRVLRETRFSGAGSGKRFWIFCPARNTCAARVGAVGATWAMRTGCVPASFPVPVSFPELAVAPFRACASAGFLP